MVDRLVPYVNELATNLTTGTAPGKYQGLKIYFAWHYNKAYADPSHQFFRTADWTQFLKAYDKAQAPGGGGQHPFPTPRFPGPGIGPIPTSCRVTGLPRGRILSENAFAFTLRQG